MIEWNCREWPRHGRVARAEGSIGMLLDWEEPSLLLDG